MSIDSMRVGGGRCPPILVVGLVIVCFMMVCNWWTLSSTNLELIHQIEELNEQIRISAEERDQCVTQTKILSSQLKTCQEEKNDKMRTISKKEDKLSTCNTELESYKQNDISRSATLETLRMSNKVLKDDNEKLKEEIKNSKAEFEKLKLSLNAPQPKITPVIPAADLLEKLHEDNKTEVKSAPVQKVNAQQNVPILEAPDAQDKENSANKEDNAAEVNDVMNSGQDLNFNLLPDGNKVRETQKK